MKKLRVKIVMMNGARRTLTFKPPKGHVIGERSVDQILNGVCNELDTKMPESAFRIVPLISGNYNIIEIKKDETPQPTGFQPAGLLDAKCPA